MSKDSRTLALSVDSETALGDRDVNPSRSKSSRADLRDMLRMGKRQELSRNFSFLSIVCFISLAMGTWIGSLSTNLVGAADGGLSNFVWTYVVVFLCWCCVVASLSELTSMAPTSGGQYHWVSEFAPPRVARLLSYVTGWSCVFAWQLAFLANASGLPQNIQDFLTLTGSDYTFTAWQNNLIIIATTFLCVLFNTNIGNSLPLLGGALALLFICGFFAIVIPLWVLAPRTEIEMVFLSFSNRGDPGGIARSLLLGVFPPLYSLMAPDVAAHMSEEVRDSSLVLPRAMMTSLAFNGILGFLSLITFCFTVGDINAVLSTGVNVDTQIFFNISNSATVAISMTMIIQILGIAQSCINLTSASRQLFAFARDKGVPYASFISHVRSGWKIPLNAVLVTFGISVILSLISIASNQIITTVYSAAVTGILFSYTISIGCVRLKRWRSEPLPDHRWSLGKWGAPLNDVSLIFLVTCFVLFCIPDVSSDVPITPDNMNYSSVVFVGMTLLSLLFYYVKGRRVYINPVTLVRKDI